MVVVVEQQKSRWKAAGQLCTWAVVFLDVHFNDNPLRANHTMPLMPMLSNSQKLDKGSPFLNYDPGIKVILILTKVGILISTWFQVVPFSLRFSKKILFLIYDTSFCCL